VLPTESIDLSVTSAAAFARRYRFRVPPATVTLRSLDVDRPVHLASSEPIVVADRAITVTIDDFARLHGVRCVFVTENYINFLAFPNVNDAIVVFGQGFDVGKIARFTTGVTSTRTVSPSWTICARFCRPCAQC
jgi:hypothetical protein